MSPADFKQFSTLAAKYALLGHSLIQATSGDTQAPFYAAKWGWLKPVHSLDEACKLLEQIRGKQ